MADAPTPLPAAAPLRILYVLGYGRSGSTVLDAVLGSLPGVVGTGELARFDPGAGPAAGSAERCACGEGESSCPFWSAVAARWRAAGHDPAAYARARARVERAARLPLSLALRSARPAPGAWARPTAALFAAVAAESGARVVVDSSKQPARALALARTPGLDVFLLHLVRDGRGVAYSLGQRLPADGRGVQRELPPRSVTRTALAWRLVNALASRVRARATPQRAMLLRYEDYLADLPGALAPLAPFLGLAPDDLRARLTATDSFPPGHAIAGNRVRMNGAIRLRADTAWHEGLGAKERARVWRVAGGLLTELGYPEGPGER